MGRFAAIVVALVWSSIAVAAPSHDSPITFKGQKISVIIGYGVGGGYDIYGRMVARFLGKYLPGDPMVVAENMTGAGSLSAAEYIYTVAPKDGTTLGVIGQTIPVDQLLEKDQKSFDSSKFTWIGRMAAGVETIAVWHTSPVQSIDQAKKIVAHIAATGPSSGSSIYPVVLNNLIGTKFKVISGYAGSREMLLAMQRGEADGCGAIDASTLTSGFPQWLAENKIKVLTQVSLKRDPAFPDTPTFVELGRTSRERQILKLYAASGDIGRALLAPPGLSPARTKLLRKAFMKMMRDPDLLAFAKKGKIEISPMQGDALQKIVADISAAPPEIIKAARAAQTPPK